MGCVAGTLRQQRPSSEPSMGPRVEGLTGQGGRPRAPQQVGEGKADQGVRGTLELSQVHGPGTFI